MMKPNTIPKLIKKQKKMSKGANKAVQRSLSRGDVIGPVHVGAVPEFSIVRDPSNPYTPPIVFKKTKGVPFVNTTLRRQ